MVLVARRAELIDALAEALRAEHGVAALGIASDLGSPAGIADLIHRTTSLDIGLLVASAGFGTSGPFIDGDVEDELAMIDVNCRAVAALAHHFGNRFARQRRGGIILMSSLVAFQGVPRAANYAATKAYVQSLAEGTRIELAPLGVDVLSVAPGPIHSGFAARANMKMGMGQNPAAVADAALDALGRRGTV